MVANEIFVRSPQKNYWKKTALPRLNTLFQSYFTQGALECFAECQSPFHVPLLFYLICDASVR